MGGYVESGLTVPLEVLASHACSRMLHSSNIEKAAWAKAGQIMADGMWVLHDDGRFELQEPYRTMLQEAKVTATKGWAEALIGYLEPKCPYTQQQLADELLRRNEVREEGKMQTFEEFVLEALSGDL